MIFCEKLGKGTLGLGDRRGVVLLGHYLLEREEGYLNEPFCQGSRGETEYSLRLGVDSLCQQGLEEGVLTGVRGGQSPYASSKKDSGDL